MKIIKCKNVTEYNNLEKRACTHLGIPNKHHDRYSPPPNANNLDFPVTSPVEALFQGENITVKSAGEALSEKKIAKKKAKKKARKKIFGNKVIR